MREIHSDSIGRRVAMLAIFLTLSLSAPPVFADPEPPGEGEAVLAPLASPEEVKEAARVFDEWIAAYRAKDYKSQWSLTHPRIRKWYDLDRWRKAMKDARRRGGALVDIRAGQIGAVEPAKIPCTEHGHCYREDMQTVLVIVDTTYEKAPKSLREYAIMANSEDGWRWGGGTVLKLPMGETVVILDRKDERMIRTRVERSAKPE